MVLSSVLTTIYAENNKNEYTSDDVISLFSNFIMEEYKDKIEDEIFYLGNPVKFYQFSDSELQESKYEIYPIYDSNKKMIYTFYVYGTDAKLSTMVTDELTEYISRGKFIAVIDDDEVTFNYDNENGLTNEMFDRYGYNSSLQEFNALNETSADSVNAISLSLPNKKQAPYNNGCWAACMASMIQYYTGSSETVSSVRSACGVTSDVTKTASQIVSYLRTYYDIYANSTTVATSASSVRTNLNNSKAYIIGWTVSRRASDTTVTNFGHATICDGHSYSNSKYGYNIMDPNAGSSGTNYGRYVLYSSSSSSFPTNSKIYPGSGFTLISASASYGIVYNRWEQNAR